MGSVERRSFLAALLAAIPRLKAETWDPPRLPAPQLMAQGPAGGILVPAGEDRYQVTRSVGLSSTAFKVSAGDSRRSLFVMEQANTTHGGPPLHLHHGVDEFWYVLAGEYLIEVDGRQFRAHPGDCVLGPRSMAHRWAFIGQSPGRLLITFTPAGRMEEYFSLPRKPGEYVNDPALYRRFGMELLGPSLPVS